MSELWRRLRMLFRRERFDRELEEEMQSHLEMQAEENLEHGMAFEDARYAARRQFGNPMLLAEDSRARWGWHWLECLLQDIGFAGRILRRNPGFAVVAVLTLALGIGANCLVFSVVDTVLLRPFPYRNPDRLVFVWTEFSAANQQAMSSLPDYLDWRARNQVFEDMGAYIPASFDLAGPAYSEQLHGRRASASFFHTLGVQPQLGRLFLPDEEHDGRDCVVLISDTLWRNRFQADPRVVGSIILLSRNGQPAEPYTIIGVLPARFEAAFPRYADVWGALARDGEEAYQRRMGGFDVVGRLKAGITLTQAESAMRSIAGVLAVQYPQTNRGYSVQLRDFHESLTGYGRHAMWSLSGAVAFVLLIACVNVANLMLARAADREREIMIRAAIGAGRGRLLRQLVVECLLLSVVGGAAGALLAHTGVGAVQAAMPESILRRGEIAIDLRVLAFTFAVSLLAGVAFGLIPAARASRANLNPAPARTGPSRTRLRDTLVIAEIALGLVLVTGAALTINSFVRLLRVDPGFDPRRLLSIETYLPREDYSTDTARVAAMDVLLARLKALPGVSHTGITDFRPLGSSMHITMRKRVAGATPLPVHLEAIAGDYFAAMGTPLLRGRAFTEHDAAGAHEVAIINEAAARQCWPREDPLGRQIMFGQAKRGEVRAVGAVTEGVREIVGVAADVRRMSLERAAQPAVYVPQRQQPSTRNEIVLRMWPGVSAADLARAVRAELAAVNRKLVASDVTTMKEVVDRRLSQPRFIASLLGIFGLIALALLITGVYGVTAYTVRVRTYEIGIRMALGAARREVLAAVLRRGVRLAVIGIVLGAAGAFVASRALISALYEIKPADPATFIAAALLVTAASLLASYAPARRATRINPVEALRHE